MQHNRRMAINMARRLALLPVSPFFIVTPCWNGLYFAFVLLTGDRSDRTAALRSECLSVDIYLTGGLTALSGAAMFELEL